MRSLLHDFPQLSMNSMTNTAERAGVVVLAGLVLLSATATIWLVAFYMSLGAGVAAVAGLLSVAVAAGPRPRSWTLVLVIAYYGVFISAATALLAVLVNPSASSSA